MKGVILAGGNGTRLRPMTLVTNKSLLPVYDKPMILFPLNTLKEMGVTDILIISGGNHIGAFMDFLKDGSDYGVNLTYKVQKEAGGIAHALALAEDFVGTQFVVILGDNIYEYAPEVPLDFHCGIVVTEAKNPERFGVYYNGKIIEKPKEFVSNTVVTGLYFYTKGIFDFIKTLKPSVRGEMEITDVNNWCLKNLPIDIIKYQGFWSDAGTPDSLLASSNFIYEKEKRKKE